MGRRVARSRKTSLGRYFWNVLFYGHSGLKQRVVVISCASNSIRTQVHQNHLQPLLSHEQRPTTGKAPRAVGAGLGGNGENCGGKQGRGGSKIAKLKISLKTHGHIPKVGKPAPVTVPMKWVGLKVEFLTSENARRSYLGQPEAHYEQMVSISAVQSGGTLPGNWAHEKQ